MRSTLTTAGQVAGLVLTSIGAYAVYAPFGIITAGVSLFVVSWSLEDES
jgi:hypothetical protein